MESPGEALHSESSKIPIAAPTRFIWPVPKETYRTAQQHKNHAVCCHSGSGFQQEQLTSKGHAVY
jgi:hypothetical protein